ncbi:MAG: AAA family ATPase, partial [Desulfomonile tiedjei]|nr:AAA family ATPase [Desulfomonile tiedjei]
MWIEEIFIDNFGAFSRLKIKGLGQRLTVIVGPNEAGKTTMMEFVRSVFFGFRKKGSGANTYDSPGGTVRSGRLSVQTGNGRLQIYRVEKRGQKEGILTILDETGNVIERSTVPVFGPGIQRKVYETLFAFDLDRMRHLDHDALRGKIVAAALGSVQVNPLEILKNLDDQSRKWMKRSHTDKESLPAIQSQIGEIDRKLKALQERPNRYFRLTRELEQATVRRKDLSYLTSEAATELPKLEKLIQRREEWTRLVSIENQMAALQHADRFPADGIPRLEQALEQLNQAENESLETRIKLNQIQERLARLNPDPTALEHSKAIYDLSREAASLASLPAEIEECEASLSRTQRTLVSEKEALGAGWDEKRISDSDPSLRLEQEIRVFLDSFSDCRDRIKDLQVRVSESEERLRVIGEKAAAKRAEIDALSARCTRFLSLDSRAMLQEWKNNLERSHDLEQRLSEQNQQVRRLVAQKNDLESEIAVLDTKSRGLIANVFFWGILCALLSIVTGGIAGWGLNDSFSGAMVLAICLMIAAAIVTIVKIRNKRRKKRKENLSKSAEIITGDIAEIESRRRSNHRQIQVLKQRSGRIAENILQNPSAVLKDIIDAEIRSSAAEEPFRMRQALKSALRSDLTDLQSENNRKEQVSRFLAEESRTLEELRGRWERWIALRGLDQDLEPDVAIDFVRRLRDLKRSIHNIQEERTALETMKQQWEGFVFRVEGLAHLMGVSGAENPVGLVEQWVTRERETREALAEKKSISEKAQDLNVRMSVSNSKVVEAHGRIAALYEAAGVADEESFRERSQFHAHFQRLDHERRILVAGLVGGLSFSGEEDMRECLTAQDWDANRERAGFLRGQLIEMREESEEFAMRCGSLGREIRSMEHEDESDRLLAEKHEFVARMERGVVELIAAKIACSLMERTLRLYELEKQPKVLERTSEIFRTITGNGFQRVIFPLDGASIKVERSNGTMIDEELLSRGTLEQLYLSLRLAHLDVYHRDKPSIPLVMDDVLVNFDPERAKRTASALADFSDGSGIQIIFFTCHPQTG